MDTTYSPQSPDLSSYISSPPKKFHQVYNPNYSGPPSPTISTFNLPSAQQQAPTSTYNQTGPAFSLPQSQTHPLNASFGGYNAQPHDPSFESGLGISNYDHNFQIPDLPPQNIFHQPIAASTTTSIPTYYTPEQTQDYQPAYNTTAGHYRSEDSAYISADSQSLIPSSPLNMSSRQPRPPKAEATSPTQYKDPNPNNIEIRTKFPVARIKRIMQADEEVGKVAQVTPVAVSKALELFMIALVTGAAEKAKEKGGKRVTAQHLKAVVLGSPEQFDFLAEIVGRVAEVTEGAGGEGRKKAGKKEASESASEAEEEKQVKKKAKGKGGRRKKGEQE